MYPKSFLNMNPSLIGGGSLFVCLHKLWKIYGGLGQSTEMDGNTGDDDLFRVGVGGHDFACFLFWFQEVAGNGGKCMS